MFVALLLALQGMLQLWPTAAAADGPKVHAGDIVIADAGGFGGGVDQGEILRIDPETGFQTVISSRGLLVDPFGITIALDGTILVADPGANAVISIDPDTGAQSIFASGGGLIKPISLAVDGNGDIVVTVAVTRSVLKINSSTREQTVVSSRGFLQAPAGVTVLDNGDIIVADNRSGVIRIDPVTGNQTLVTTGNESMKAAGITVGRSGAIIVTDYIFGDRGVIRVTPFTGVQETVSTGGHLVNPFGLDIDLEGNIWVADPADLSPTNSGAEAILRIDPESGEQVLVSAGGRLVNPHGLVIYPATVELLGPAAVSQGAEFEVELRISRVEELAGAQLEVSYDARALSVVSAELAPELADDCVSAARPSDGKLKLAMACGSGQTGNFTAWNVTFRALTPRATLLASLSVTNLLLNDINVFPNIIQGSSGIYSVHVILEACGDYDGNDAFEIIDVVIGMQILVDLLEATPSQQFIGDLNQNGNIDVGDSIIALQHLVGITDTLVCGLT